MTKFLRAIIQSGDQAVRNVCPLRTPQSAHLNPIYTFYNGPQIRDVAATQTWKLLQFLLMRFLKIKSCARLYHGSHWCSCHAVVFPTESPAKQWECHAARTLPVTCIYLVACISHICDYECVTPTGNTHDHAGPCFITNVVSALGYEFKSPKKVRNKSSSYHNVTIKQLFRNL